MIIEHSETIQCLVCKEYWFPYQLEQDSDMTGKFTCYDCLIKKAYKEGEQAGAEDVLNYLSDLFEGVNQTDIWGQYMKEGNCCECGEDWEGSHECTETN